MAVPRLAGVVLLESPEGLGEVAVAADPVAVRFIQQALPADQDMDTLA